MIGTLFHVALGGAIGATGRYLTTIGMARLMGAGFPYGTLVVNVVGSFAIGLLFVWLIERDAVRLAPLLMTGVLGGFTTFSAFSLDVLMLIERGDVTAAALYGAASVGLSLLAVAAGLALARSFVA